MTTELYADGVGLTLGAAITTTPAAGTVETNWSLTFPAGATLTAPGSTTGQYRLLVDKEIVLWTAGTVTAGATTTGNTVTRGMEGTAPATHISGAECDPNVTSGGLGNTVQFNPSAAQSGSLNITGTYKISGTNLPQLNTLNTFSQPQTLTSFPATLANGGILQVGTAPFDGTSSGYFTGNAYGTGIAANFPSGYQGHILAAQINGIPQLEISLTTSGDLDFQTHGNRSIRMGSFDGSNVNGAFFQLYSNTQGNALNGRVYFDSGALNSTTPADIIFRTGWGTGTLTDRLRITGIGTLNLTTAPPATPNYGLLNVGPGPWDGTSAGYFKGSASGTGIAANFPSGYSGDLFNLQVDSTSHISCDAAGNFRANVLQTTQGWLFLDSARLLGHLETATSGFPIFHGSNSVTNPILQIVPAQAGQTANMVEYLSFNGRTLSSIGASGAFTSTANLTLPDVSAPTTAPTATVDATAGNLGIGTYAYAVGFTTPQGTTIPGPTVTSATTASGSQQITLGSIPLGGSGVTERQLYRSKVGTTTPLYQLAVLTDNTTTSYVDNIADTSLTVAAPTVSTAVPLAYIEGTPPTTANYGLLNVGPGPWDGTSTGYFRGSGSGTLIALCQLSNSGRDVINYVQNGSSAYRIDVNGNTISSGHFSTTGGFMQFNPNGQVIIQSVGGAPGQQTHLQIIQDSLELVGPMLTLESSSNVVLTSFGETGAFTSTANLTLPDVPAPTTVPTATVDVAAGNLGIGTYTYAVGNTTPQGTTLFGPTVTSAATVAGSQQITLASIPLGGGGVTERQLYRSKVGTTTPLYQLAVLSDNTTTSYVDNIADTSLTVAAPTVSTAVPLAYFEGTPPATANYGLLNVGPGPWDGTSAGHFVGNANGTGIAANFPSGYTGDYFNAQVGGTNGLSLGQFGGSPALIFQPQNDGLVVWGVGTQRILIRTNATNDNLVDINGLSNVTLHVFYKSGRIQAWQGRNGSDNLEVDSFGRINAMGSSAPTAIAGTQAGGTPPAPVVEAGSADMQMKITFGTGTAPAAGDQVAVTFNAAYTNAPFGVNLTSGNAATASLLPFIDQASITTTGFNIAFANAPAASQANTVYNVLVTVIGR